MIGIEFVQIPRCLHKLGLASGWDLGDRSLEAGKLSEVWLHVYACKDKKQG